MWSVWDEASEFAQLVRSGWGREFVEHWFLGTWQLEDPDSAMSSGGEGGGEEEILTDSEPTVEPDGGEGDLTSHPHPCRVAEMLETFMSYPPLTSPIYSR